MNRTRSRSSLVMIAAAVALVASSCGSDSSTSSADSSPAAVATAESGLRTVTADDAAAFKDDAPADLVVLDVRTPEEFDEGHLADATLLDFYRQDFAAELAKLDPDQPYLLYCRSGNRSGQTMTLMQQLGFTDVTEIDGGFVAWQQAGLPTVTP